AEVFCDQHDVRDEPVPELVCHGGGWGAGREKRADSAYRSEEGERFQPDREGDSDDEGKRKGKERPLGTPERFPCKEEITLPAIAPAEHARVYPFPLLIGPDEHRPDRVPDLAEAVAV